MIYLLQVATKISDFILLQLAFHAHHRAADRTVSFQLKTLTLFGNNLLLVLLKPAFLTDRFDYGD